LTPIPIQKIAINTRLLMRDKLDGIGWFTYQVVKRWVENNPNIQFYFLFDRDYDSSFIFGNNVTPIVVSPPARHPILWYIWFEWMIPRALHKINPDIFISLDTYTTTRWKGRKLTAIHDIAFALFDGQSNWLTEWFLRHYTPQYINASEKIITVSQSTKNDLISFYKCPASKIIVSNNAADEIYKPLPEREKEKFKAENTNNCDYFIFVGSIHPRKNVLNLLKAFEKYKLENNTNVKLVLIGRIWKYEDITSYLSQMQYKDAIIQIPHSPPEIIAQWVASAIALIMVSHYEGFGVPIIEALACGVPVICSNVSSMPEVAGEAAILVAPKSADEIARAMYLLSNDVHLRNQLIDKTSFQTSKYNWDEAARIIWEEI